MVIIALFEILARMHVRFGGASCLSLRHFRSLTGMYTWRGYIYVHEHKQG